MSQELAVANRRRQAQIVRGSVLPLLAQTPGLTKSAISAVRGLLESYSQKSPMPTQPSNAGQNSNARKRKPKSNRKQKPAGGGRIDRGLMLAPVSRSTGEDSITGVYTDFYDLNSTGTGAVANAWELALNSPTGGTLSPISVVVGRVSTIGAAYRQYKINWIRFSYFSLLPSTSGGFLALGVDTQPCIGQPASQGAVIRHNGAVMGDIKDEYSVMYKPTLAGKTGYKYIQQSTGTTYSPDEMSYGVVQTFGQLTGATAATLIGKVKVEMSVTFIGAT